MFVNAYPERSINGDRVWRGQCDVIEQTDRIEHVPRILYHWRKLPGSVASSTEAKQGISELQAAAVNRHLERCEIAIQVVHQFVVENDSPNASAGRLNPLAFGLVHAIDRRVMNHLARLHKPGVEHLAPIVPNAAVSQPAKAVPLQATRTPSPRATQ